MVSYSEIITSNGVKIPFDPDIITPKIERPMRNNRYEGGECKALREHLEVGDRVLQRVSRLARRSHSVASRSMMRIRRFAP